MSSVVQPAGMRISSLRCQLTHIGDKTPVPATGVFSLPWKGTVCLNY